MKIYVKPSRPGLVVKDKLGRLIPSEGKLVCYDIFIKRLLNSGDLIAVDTRKRVIKKKEEKNATSSTE